MRGKQGGPGYAFGRKLYTRQLQLHPTPPAVSLLSLHIQFGPVMPAVNGHTHTSTHTAPSNRRGGSVIHH